MLMKILYFSKMATKNMCFGINGCDVLYEKINISVENIQHIFLTLPNHYLLF